jgi:rhamnosyltransferase
VKALLCIPTLNAGADALSLLFAMKSQTFRPTHFVVIDSGSTDGSVELFEAAGAAIRVIERSEFNHGATRQMAVEAGAEADVVVFFTQDAIPADADALRNLLACFDDPGVGAAFGRQLPRPGAGPIAAHARLFNYPSESRVKTAADAPELGIKTAFISNSFAAFRRAALMSVGGFPGNVILSEDTYVAAKMLLAGWKVAYCAEALVYHSHDYGFMDEFKRYFDIGVFHAREPWIRQEFGQPAGEGVRFVRSELAYLMKTQPVLIPSALMRSVLKFAGYKMGTRERRWPLWLKRRLSMHAGYWKSN